MSRHGYGHGYGYGGLEDVVGGLVGLAIVLAVIAFVLLVRAIVYIVQTFRRYGKVSKGLWRSLWVSCGCVVLSVALALLFQQQVFGQAFSVITYIGFFQLLIVCKIVQTRYSQTVMKEQYSIVADVLRKDWWSSYDDTAIAA